MRNHLLLRPLHLIAALAFLLFTTPGYAQKFFPWPPSQPAVEKAVSDENLKAVAANTDDPDVLLGLAYLSQVGSPVKEEILARVVKLKPEYAPAATVLVLTMDRYDSEIISQLLQKDPDNALGHYLRALEIYREGKGKEQEALSAFRKATTFKELRLYKNLTADALFKALDVLKLQGRDRLYASSWIASRESNFSTICLQSLYPALSELSIGADLETRKAISDLLLALGGHLHSIDFQNRTFAQRAVHSAFRLKAEIAYEEKSPTVNGYVSVVQALASVKLNWPGISDRKDSPLEVAQFTASRINRAFAVAELIDPSKPSKLNEMRAQVPDSEKAVFELTKQQAIKTANTLIDAALVAPDEVIGAYLRGLPPEKAPKPGPWVSYYTYVERLMSKRPEIYKAAMDNEEAMRAFAQAGNSDPEERNLHLMMRIGSALYSYALDHKETYPPSLSSLYENEKYLKKDMAAKSLLSGKSFTYVAAGKKIPARAEDRSMFMLLYDETPTREKFHHCVMADGHGENATPAELKKYLDK